MEKGEKDKLSKAQTIVYRLLKFRPRSEHELRSKLKEKKIQDDIIEETISYFTELDLIDDRQFAQKWISARLNRPFGVNRIRHELIQKGIERNIIQQELNEAMKEYCEEDIVLNLAQERAQKYKNIDPQKAKQRVYGYLSRRGFSSETIYKAIKSL